MPVNSNRFFVLAAGLAGAAGVALSGAAAHAGGGAFTVTAGTLLLMHAPAFLAIGLIGGSHWLRAAGFILLIGVVLLPGDLVARDFLGTRLFPFAAPTGGTLLIVGWLVVAASSLLRERS